MDENNSKLKRKLGFAPAYGAAVGLVVSGTAMFSVGNVTGTAGFATPIASLIALIPMMMAAFAFGELTAMLPGGGMISDYTLPALGRFWSTFALLSGYLVLIAADGGAQVVMGGLSLKELTSLPQVVGSLILFGIVVIINILDVGFYGRVESLATISMMVIFAALVLISNTGLNDSLGAAKIVNQISDGILPSSGWSTVFGSVGSCIWFFIGFEFACPMAEENKKPYKNIPYALILGLISIYAIDALFSIAATKYTDLTQLSSSAIPQTIAAQAMMGKTGYIIMSLLTVLASFTTANAYISSFPRMLYGLAREGLVPSFFGKINRKTHTPVNGILFTTLLIGALTIYITSKGANADVVSGLINTASITWMVSYAIAMIDVLVLRKKYPDYPRLWKAPRAKVTMPIGIIGVIYAIYTLRNSLPYALICMAIVALYSFVWSKFKRIELFTVMPIDQLANNIRARSEKLPVWDEAIDQWCKEHGNK